MAEIGKVTRQIEERAGPGHDGYASKRVDVAGRFPTTAPLILTDMKAGFGRGTSGGAP